MVKVILVDDHKIVRDGIKAMLIGDDRYAVVGETDTSAEAIALVHRLEPQLILLDLKLPGESGIDIALKIKADHPGMKIIMLTAEANAIEIRKAVKAGIDGLLSKESDPTFFVKIFDKVMAGGRHIGQEFTEAIFDLNERDQLTEREIEIIHGFANGLSYKEIGAELNISARTVETHKKNIQEKLNFSTLADMVKYAVRVGIVKA